VVLAGYFRVHIDLYLSVIFDAGFEVIGTGGLRQPPGQNQKSKIKNQKSKIKNQKSSGKGAPFLNRKSKTGVEGGR